MRVGLVCPYTWEVPGGVREHVSCLAEALTDLGHEVSVIAPADDDAILPPYVMAAGRAVPVPYNGSVARLAFGFLSASRVRRWLKDGDFDVLHVHEPAAPSLSPHVNGLIEYMVETAGSEKVVFGSDLPWYSQHYHAGAVLFARISDDARHDILHRNAERLLGQHLAASSPPS